jgi:NAD(P)-dependent dehydrogenase (short-subunit alcohol dehydrogenase family)
MRLTDKKIIVTGGGSGFGAAMCRLFAREGARVLVADKRKDAAEAVAQACAAKGATAVASEVDVSKEADARRMVNEAVRAFGRLDVLVNNAGYGIAGSVVETDEEAWDALMAVNVRGVYLCAKHAIPAMAANGGGSIVNTASTSGLRWTGSAQVGYASTKAGVIHFSRVTAVEYAPRGIRVNTVVPGQMHTPMVETRLAGQRTGGDVDALLQSRVARIPLGFMGDGRDTAYAALFLASDEARFITGTEIIVDGGMVARCD